MKKIISAISLVLALMLCVCACAETVQYKASVNMEQPLTDMTVHIAFNTKNDMTDSDITAQVYGLETFDNAAVDQLKVGDELETSAGTVTVNTVERTGSDVVINGGFDEDGITLYPAEDGSCYYVRDFELPSMIMLGQAQLQFADTVKINVYKMTEDMSIAGEGYDTVEVPGTEAAAEIARIGEKFYDELGPYNTTVVIGPEEQVITELTVDYMP